MLGIKLNPVQFLDRVGHGAPQARCRARCNRSADAIYDRYEKRGTRLRHRQRRQRLQRLALLRRPRQRHPAPRGLRQRPKETAAHPQPDRQHALHPRLGQRRGLRPRLRRAAQEPRQPRRSADRHQRLRQQPEHPAGRRMGQPARREHVRLHRLHRRQAHEPGPARLHVPLDDMGIVESIHLTAFHWIVDHLHARIGLEMNPDYR